LADRTLLNPPNCSSHRRVPVDAETALQVHQVLLLVQRQRHVADGGVALLVI
jgi:hypothetical protein